MERNNSQSSLVVGYYLRYNFFFIFKLPIVLKFKRVYIVCTLLMYQLHHRCIYRCIYHVLLHILRNIFEQFVAFVIYHDNLNRILWDDQRSKKFSFFRLNARCQFAWFTLNLIVGFIDFKDGSWNFFSICLFLICLPAEILL